MILSRLYIIVLLIKVPTLAVARDSTIEAKLESVVRNFGYPFQTKEIPTSDGYVLGLHRIPGQESNKSNHTSSRPPVLLMHGLLGSSADWLITGPKQSLAFLLHDHGYDVWLGNNRGNTYSKKHLTINSATKSFWNFSWHEFGLYDLPALIDYILKETNFQKLYYVGYSQGCTQFYVMGSLRPEYNHKVMLMISLAPVAFMGNTRDLFGPFLRFTTIVGVRNLQQVPFIYISTVFWSVHLAAMEDFTSELAGYFEVFANKNSLNDFIRAACNQGMFPTSLCQLMLIDWAVDVEWDKEKMDMVVEFTPAGCSSKQFLHFGICINNPGHFKQYDYGFLWNYYYYSSYWAPDYPLRQVTTPIIIFNGLNDSISHPKDVEILAERLPNVVEKLEMTVTLLNHFDFMYGSSVRSIVYNNILCFMESFLSTDETN